MELLHLRYFLAVAQAQHITQTASSLHISQPALTKIIHHLEEELGVPLFASRGRGIVLTEYGKHLQKRLTPLIRELDTIPGELQTMAHLENTTIHLNVLAASSIVTEAIMEYRKQNDRINFQMLQNDESPLYDIGVTTKLFYQLPEKNMDHEFIFTERIFLAVPASHPLADRRCIELKEAAGEGFISLMGSRQLRWICDRFCQHAGFSPRIIFESDSPAAVKNMIAANLGVGFWPEFTWGRLETDNVSLLEIREPVCQRDILFDYKQNKTNCSDVKDFFEYLRAYCERARRMADHDLKFV